MTEITEGFSTPSERGKWPTLKQLSQAGALLVFKTTRTDRDVPDNFNPGRTKTQITATVVVLSINQPISVVLDQHGQAKAQLDEPVQAGTEMKGFVVSQPGITRDLEGRETDRNWPGLIGTLGTYPTNKGNPGWKLVPPTPEQLEQANRWLAWKRQQPGGVAAMLGGAATPVATQQAAPGPEVQPQAPVQQQAAAPWEASGSAQPAATGASAQKAPWE